MSPSAARPIDVFGAAGRWPAVWCERAAGGQYGVVIAVIVLLPEAIAAARNALNDRVQVGLNLAYGSAAASIVLIIPAIAVASIWLPGQLILGLSSLQITLLALTVLPGRATILQGALHLGVCASFFYLAAIP